MVWHPVTDVFRFHYEGCFERGSTKRKLLSELAEIFDPLGWLAPVTITLKMLMQLTWIKGLQWDDALPPDVEETWEAAHEQLKTLPDLQFRRSICAERKKSVELHVFADASERAYAAVLYARVTKMDGSVTTKLLACKTKVTTLMLISIPKLELCAAHLAAKLMRACLSAISKTHFVVSNKYAWSDSTIALAWISGEPRRWNTFVLNRVSEIIEIILETRSNGIQPSCFGIERHVCFESGSIKLVVAWSRMVRTIY